MQLNIEYHIYLYLGIVFYMNHLYLYFEVNSICVHSAPDSNDTGAKSDQYKTYEWDRNREFTRISHFVK